LRIALLSALAEPPEPGGASAEELPAFRRFAGKTVLAHQIDCAAHLGCERVLCLASATGTELSAASAYAERSGLRFETVGTVPRLAAQVTADDDIVLIADGVLPDSGVVLKQLGPRAGVLAFPAEPALDLGFERLDASRAWTGVLRARGDSVARLADLPPDCDLASSLLRIALQAGGRIVDLDPQPLREATWQRRVSSVPGADTEWRWIVRQVEAAPFAAPGQAIVERIGLRWAHDFGGGRWARAPHLAAAAGSVLTLLALLADWPLAGLGALLATHIALAVAGMFDRVEALGAPTRAPGRMLRLLRWSCDGLLWALLARLTVTVPGSLALMLPLMLVGVLHLGALLGGKRMRALFSDRIALISAIFPLAYAGWTTLVVAGAVVLGLAALLLEARRHAAEQLTTD
jgi:hypothetical protein